MITNRSKATGSRVRARVQHRFTRSFMIDIGRAAAWARAQDPNSNRNRRSSLFETLNRSKSKTKPPDKPPPDTRTQSDAFGPTKGEVTAAANRAAKKAASGSPAGSKVLWRLAWISLRSTRTQGQASRYALQEYVAQQMLHAIQQLTPLQRERIGKTGLDMIAQQTVADLQNSLAEMVAGGRRLRYQLTRGRMVIHAATPGSNHRNCFLVCEPDSLRVIAAQTTARFQKSQRNRFRDPDRGYRRHR